MTIGHSPYAPTNPFAPEPVGVCDRCGFLYHLASLREQMRWSGSSVVGTGLRVCPRDLDVLQQNGQRRIYLDGDPKPLRNPRPSALWDGQAPRAVQFVLDETDADVLDVDFLGDGDTSDTEFTDDFDDEFAVRGPTSGEFSPFDFDGEFLV